MQPMTVTEIASAVKGVWWNPSEQVPVVSAVSTDSRRIVPGSLFLPWVGEKFDGHLFIDAALDAGAAGCLCAKLPQNIREDKFYIKVADTRLALRDLASASFFLRCHTGRKAGMLASQKERREGGTSVEYDLILARSVTYAQRMQRALNRAGIRSQLFRAPRDLTDLGCAYVVRISPYDLGAALPLLRREGLGPLRIYVQRGGDIQEVGL